MTERSVDWSSVADLGSLPSNTGPTLGALGAFDDAVTYPPQASEFPPPPGSRVDQAFDASVGRWKQLAKDVFFAPVEAQKAFDQKPTFSNFLGIAPMGGLGKVPLGSISKVRAPRARASGVAEAPASYGAPAAASEPSGFSASVSRIAEPGAGPFEQGGFSYKVEGPGFRLDQPGAYPSEDAARRAATDTVSRLQEEQRRAGADPATFTGFNARPQAPYVAKANAPLFDYSAAKGVPTGVEQRPLDRWWSPKGPSENGQRVLDDKDAWKKIDEWAARGAKEGGLDWYNVQPFKDEFIAELGPKVGADRFKLWADLEAATSPRTSVPQNTKIASYYYNELVNGRPVPQRIRKPDGGFALDTPMPEGYGSMAQILHAYNVENLTREGGWSPAMNRANPKPVSFSQNIQGNQRPYTIDAHMNRAIKYGADRPTDADYPFLEQRFIERANRMGLESGQHQASAWLGVPGSVTKVRPESRASLLEQIERVIASTADQLGTTKPKAMKQFIRGKTPLY